MPRARAVFSVGPRTFELHGDTEAGGGPALRFDGPLGALLWLRKAAASTSASVALRRFLAEATGALPSPWAGDDEILAQLASLLAAGRVVVVERPEPWLSAAGPISREQDAPRPIEVDPEPRSEQRRTWITIELVGEDDAPMPGERYRIELPDGSLREGRLDARGLARVFEIDSGQCVVTFPDLDEEAWTFLGTTGEP